MRYKHFYNILKLYETPSIKALYIPESCCIDQIPGAFALLIPDIINILEEHREEFCQPHELLGVYGLQPSGGFLTSELPKKLNRIFHFKVPDYHLCCTFDYIPLEPKQSLHGVDWTHFKSVIVDFTRGQVMNTQQYCSELFNDDKKRDGKIYGIVDQTKLTAIWEIVKDGGYKMGVG